MKHSIHTQKGTGFWSRHGFAALILLGLLADVGMFAVPAISQDDFPWATRINVICPSASEIQKAELSSGALPDWAKSADPGTSLANLALYLNRYHRDPFFSPDGKWIVFDDRMIAAWMVPVEGGEPKLAADWYWKLTYSSDGVIVGGTAGIWQTCGTSSDGKEIVGIRKLFREGEPAVDTLMVTLPDGSTAIGGTILAYATDIVSRNIETKEERIIAKDAMQGRWSHSGRWFVFVKRDPEMVPPGGKDDYFSWEPMITGLFVLDLTNGREWRIAPVATFPCFTPDDSAIVCSLKDSNGLWQIFSIPREGGVPKQLSFYGPNDTGRNARVSDVSPDGRWILHTGDYTIGSGTKTGLCVCSMTSGISYPLFPEATCITTEGSWSPDGKKIVFSTNSPYFSDGLQLPDKYEMYIADFNGNAFEKLTGVAEATPVNFALTGNYPNPFNPTTTISFTLPSSGAATLSVYSVSGQKVRELVGGPMGAGAHSVVWDGRDASGRPVSSGVYITRLSQGNHTAAGRMLLAK